MRFGTSLYPCTAELGYTKRESFAKRDPVPEKRPPERFLGCVELHFGNSNRVDQSHRDQGKNVRILGSNPYMVLNLVWPYVILAIAKSLENGPLMEHR